MYRKRLSKGKRENMNQKRTRLQTRTAYRGVIALAKELGVSRFHLSRVLNGHRYAGEWLADALAARGVIVKVRGDETSSTSPAGRSLESARLAGPAGKTSSDNPKSMPYHRRLRTRMPNRQHN